MKCPICGKEVTLQNKQVGVTEDGEPILNQYAICRDCKKQWNLDKQRAKKMAAAGAAKKDAVADTSKKAAPADTSKKAAPADSSETKPASAPAAGKEKVSSDTKPIPRRKLSEAIAAGEKAAATAADRAKRPEKSDSDAPAKRPAKADPDAPAKRPAKTDSNAPAKRPVKADSDAPAKRPVKTNPDAPARRPKKAGPEGEERPVRKARSARDGSARGTAPKKKPATAPQYGNIPPEKERIKQERAVKKGYEDMLAADPKSEEAKKRAAKKAAAAEQTARSKKAVKETKTNVKQAEPEEEDDYYEELPRFRVLRVVLGILSLAAAAYFGYTGFQTTSIPYYALAGCMGVSALLLLILQKSNTLVTYLLPMMLYTAGGVFAFLERDDDPVLLYASIVSVVLGVIFLILAFSSRGEEEEEYDDWDDEDGDWNDR